VPIPRYKENIRKIIYAAQTAGAKVVIIGPGPFNHHQFVAVMEKGWLCDRTTLRARMYCNAAAELGTEFGVPVVPLWELVMADLGWVEGNPVFGLEEVEGAGGLEEYLSDGKS
jgi:hypothetical protein